MRVQPRALIAVVAAAGYMAIVSVLWWATGVSYSKIAETSVALFIGIVVPVGVGAVFLTVTATVLGWWRPAMFEKKVGHGWMWLAPAFMLIAALALIASRDLTKMNPVWALTLGAGVLLVGFSEEIMTRGICLVGYRGSLSESWAWFAMSLTFGLLHGLNLLFGQALLPTLQQVLVSFVAASVFYVLRRVSGFLLWAMILHAIWDFASLAGSTVLAGPGAIFAVLSFLQYAGMLVALVAVWRLVVADRSVSQGLGGIALGEQSQRSL
jgi:uncharacterized protein